MDGTKIFWIAISLIVVYAIFDYVSEQEEMKRDKVEAEEFNRKVRSGEIKLTNEEKRLMSAFPSANDKPTGCEDLDYSDCIYATEGCEWIGVSSSSADGFCTPD